MGVVDLGLGNVLLDCCQVMVLVAKKRRSIDILTNCTYYGKNVICGFLSLSFLIK
jgi:hypothetical protein